MTPITGRSATGRASAERCMPLSRMRCDSSIRRGGPGDERPCRKAPLRARRNAASSSQRKGGGRLMTVRASPAAAETGASPVFGLTDLGNAARFLAGHGGDFRFCPVIGWLAWAGTRWSVDGAEGLLDQAVHLTVQAIGRKTVDDATLKWAHTSQSAGHINCIGKLVRPYVEVSAAALDADPFKINVLNNTLVIHRGEGDYIVAKNHDRADLITKLAPVTYDPEATCPTYDRFLAEVQPDEKVRRFLHQWGGLSLTGDVSEHRMVVFWGKGANGKSTLLESWAHVAGGHAASIAVARFLRQGRPRRDV